MSSIKLSLNRACRRSVYTVFMDINFNETNQLLVFKLACYALGSLTGLDDDMLTTT